MDLNNLQAKVCEGDKSAEEQLFFHLTVSFRRFARRRIWTEEDAEEIVQDALTKIAMKYKDIEFTESFTAWAYFILKCGIIDHLRSKQRREDRDARMKQMGRWQASSNPNPTFETRLLDCLKKVSRANIRYARMLNLHYQGYTTGEICEKVKITSNNFYVTLSRARAIMVECLGTKGIM